MAFIPIFSVLYLGVLVLLFRVFGKVKEIEVTEQFLLIKERSSIKRISYSDIIDWEDSYWKLLMTIKLKEGEVSIPKTVGGTEFLMKLLLSKVNVKDRLIGKWSKTSYLAILMSGLLGLLGLGFVSALSEVLDYFQLFIGCLISIFISIMVRWLMLKKFKFDQESFCVKTAFNTKFYKYDKIRSVMLNKGQSRISLLYGPKKQKVEIIQPNGIGIEEIFLN